MALVKKLQTGGSAFTLDDEINKELATYKLPSKKERIVRDFLGRLRDHANVTGNSFTADDVTNKYTVTGPGSEKFNGSPDEIRSN